MPKWSFQSTLQSGMWVHVTLCTSLFKRNDSGQWPSDRHRDHPPQDCLWCASLVYMKSTQLVAFIYFSTFLWHSNNTNAMTQSDFVWHNIIN